MTPTITNFLFCLLLLGLISVPISLNASEESSDFPCAYVSAMRIKSGQAADVYVVEHQREFGHKIFPKNDAMMLEPPYALWAVAPLAWLDPRQAKLLYTVLLIVVISASLVVTAKVTHLTKYMVLVLLGVSVASGPVFEVIRISKPIPLFLFGLVNCILCLQQKREIGAGAWLALCLFKPQELLPFILFSIGGRRFKMLASFATVSLMVALISFLIFGTQGYLNFFALHRYISMHPEIPGVVMMPVLKGQLLRLSVSEHLASVLSTTVYAVALMFVLWLGWFKRTVLDWWVPGVVASFLCVTWTMPYMHLYDFIILIPAICYFLPTLWQAQNKIPAILVLISLALFVQPVYSVIHYYYLVPQARIDLHFCAMLLIALIGTKQLIECQNTTTAG